MKLIAQFYKDKKILVTGGAGFIGSHLVEKLIEFGAKVTVIDNFSTGNLNNLKSVITKVDLVYGDISNFFTTANATINKDIVFHLAALVSVSESVKNPELCRRVNFEGTKNLLQACRKNNISKFIFSSSAAVYGNKNSQCDENDPANPINPYGQYKLESEKLCKKYFSEHNINTAILRYFNVYGPRQNPKGDYAAVVAKFTENLLHQKPIVIFGDGKQTRDFIHVSEVVKANLLIATQENLSGEVYNIATGKSINLFELLEKLEKETNTKHTDIMFQASRQGDILNSAACINKYKNLKV